jgi:hypothetical protein
VAIKIGTHILCKNEYEGKTMESVKSMCC